MLHSALACWHRWYPALAGAGKPRTARPTTPASSTSSPSLRNYATKTIGDIGTIRAWRGTGGGARRHRLHRQRTGQAHVVQAGRHARLEPHDRRGPTHCCIARHRIRRHGLCHRRQRRQGSPRREVRGPRRFGPACLQLHRRISRADSLPRPRRRRRDHDIAEHLAFQRYRIGHRPAVYRGGAPINVRLLAFSSGALVLDQLATTVQPRVVGYSTQARPATCRWPQQGSVP